MGLSAAGSFVMGALPRAPQSTELRSVRLRCFSLGLRPRQTGWPSLPSHPIVTEELGQVLWFPQHGVLLRGHCEMGQRMFVFIDVHSCTHGSQLQQMCTHIMGKEMHAYDTDVHMITHAHKCTRVHMHIQMYRCT